MPATQITDNAFIEAVVSLVEASPEFVYHKRGQHAPYQSFTGRCAYVYDGKPDCLIGQALVLAGVPVGELDSAEQLCPGDLGADDFTEQFGLSEPVRHWAGNVQVRQDDGHPWSFALAYADHPSNGGRPRG